MVHGEKFGKSAAEIYFENNFQNYQTDRENPHFHTARKKTRKTQRRALGKKSIIFPEVEVRLRDRRSSRKERGKQEKAALRTHASQSRRELRGIHSTLLQAVPAKCKKAWNKAAKPVSSGVEWPREVSRSSGRRESGT